MPSMSWRYELHRWSKPMPKGDFELSIFNTKGAAKAIEKLIATVAGAIGTIYHPVDKIINAHADVKVQQIKLRAKQTQMALSERAAKRVTHSRRPVDCGLPIHALHA